MWIRHIIDETPTGAVSPKKAGETIAAKVAELDNMARGSALSTGTTVDIDHYGEYVPGVGVGTLEDIAFQYAVDYGGVRIGERGVPNQWEETGFGTLLVPGVHIGIGTEDTAEVPGHSQANADLGVSPAGNRSLILTTKVMAATGLRLLRDSGLRDKAKAEHTRWAEAYNK
jgi:hypothetical protein